MARAPQRGGRWSMVQACLAAGVSRDRGRALVGDGMLPAGPLELGDVLALRVAVTVGNVVFPGENRPANVIHDPLPRVRDAVAAARELAAGAPGDAVLLVFPQQVQVARTPAELAARVLTPGTDPYLVLPVGLWHAELVEYTQALTEVA